MFKFFVFVYNKTGFMAVALVNYNNPDVNKSIFSVNDVCSSCKTSEYLENSHEWLKWCFCVVFESWQLLYICYTGKVDHKHTDKRDVLCSVNDNTGIWMALEGLESVDGKRDEDRALNSLFRPQEEHNEALLLPSPKHSLLKIGSKANRLCKY